MMSRGPIGGEFWIPEVSGTTPVRGEFTAELGEKVEVTLESGLPTGLVASNAPAPVPAPKPGDLGGHMGAAAAGSVARSRPITFWGKLDAGEPVSVFGANNVAAAGPPHYVAPFAVLGANVTLDQPYNAVRFRLDHPQRLRHLTDNESSVVKDDGSSLSVKASAEGNWLVYTPSTPATLTLLEMRAVSSCLALAQIALFPESDPEHDLRTRETQVCIDSTSPWLSVRGPQFCAALSGNLHTDTLLPDTELTVDRFAKWIEVNDNFDGLAWAVARRLNIPIQLQVQLLTSLVEGFHIRLAAPDEQTRFPGMPNEALNRVREAAAQAATDEADRLGLDPDLMGMSVWDALGQLGNKSYRERAEDLIAKVYAAVPEVGVSITTLPSQLRNSRITFAHQLRPPKGPLQDRYDRWMVLSMVTPWLLRARLLLEAGFDPQVLREKYLLDETFTLHRAQSEVLVKKLGWDKPPGKQTGRRRWIPSVSGESQPLTTFAVIRELIRTVCGH
jgi:hypothetical protein